MNETEFLQKVVTFLRARRPTWKYQSEDDILRVLANQHIVNWKVIEELKAKYKLTITDVGAAQTGIYISFQLPDVASVKVD